MPKSNQQVNLDLEDLLASKGYDVTSLDSSGKQLPTADSADVQTFHFHRDGKDYGTVTVSIDGLKNMIVYYDDEIANSGVNEDDMDGDRGMNGTSWISLVKQLKKFAQRHQLGFVLKDTDRLRTDMKRRSQNERELKEGAQLKRVKREYNQAAKNKGGDFDGSGKKIDNMKKSIRQKDIGKDKTVTEVSDDTLKSYKRASAGDAINRQNIANRTRNKDPKIAKRNAGQELAQKKLDKKTQQGVAEGWKEKVGAGLTAAAMAAGANGVVLNPARPIGPKGQTVANPYKATNTKSTEDDAWSKIEKRKAAEKKGVAEGSDSGTKILYTGKDKGGTVTISYEPDYIPGHSEKYIIRFDGKVKAEMPSLRSAVYGLTHYQFDTFRPNLQPNPKTALEQGVAKDTQTKLDEGYYGNKKMSYNDDTPQVKMIIKHNRQLEETDQRFRHIEKIFLETSDGERFGVPTNKPSRARMFARHIAEGGGYKDERWNHIAEISEDIDSLGGFIRATRSGDQFNESAQRMIGEAADKYRELRETAKRLCSGRGYNSYFESYEPPMENDNDDDLLEVFKHSSVDSRIEKALPTLNKLGIRRGKLEEADMFEQWADSLIDESLDIDGDRQAEAIIELFADEIPVGPNAEVAIGELADVIEDDDLYARLRRTAAVNPNSDARPQIIAWMQEQEGSDYRGLLAKLEAEDDDSAEDQEELKKSDQSDSLEPEKVKPKKKKPAPDAAGGMGGMPPLPGGDMGGAGGLPPLPPLPPLKEGDDTLAGIKRLLGL